MSQSTGLGTLADSGTRRRDAEYEFFNCVSTVTLGEAVCFDSTVRTYVSDADYGVKTSTAATADNASVVGIAAETVVGTTTAPAKVKVITHGFAYKIKVGAGIIATDPLVTGANAGELVKAAAGDIGGVKAVSWSATNTLIDGTTAAGYVSGWVNC